MRQLCHYGVKGMHWGVRKDDYSDVSNEDMASKIKRHNLENSYHKTIKKEKADKYQTSSEVSREMQNVTRNNKHLLDTVWKDKSTAKDVSTMSDAELRARINRLNMEQQYKKLTTVPSPGKAKALEVLDVSGDILAITASALLVGGKLYMLRK